MRKGLAIVAVLLFGLWAAPVLADSPKLDLAAWVSRNTDLASSQIAIAGPENVYSVEPLGPRLPTGEVLALVRTEAVSDAWREAHQFQSWDAHLLFDCQGRRVRVLRSAIYAERNRGGTAKPDERAGPWFSPQANMPAARLLSAACDESFSWPLRGTSAAPWPAGAGPRASLQAAAASAGSPAVAEQVREASAVLAPAAEPVADRPQAVLATAAVRAASSAPEPRRERAASPDTVQFASLTAAVTGTQATPKASFTSGPAVQGPLAVLQAGRAGPTRLFVTAMTAPRTCKRLLRSGGGWILRRVGFAFHLEEMPRRA